MGFFSWLTGRSEKEQDVYANYERVDDLVTNLKKVSTDNVTTASEAVRAAVTELNNVNGMAQFVGQVSPDCFTPTFDRVASTIDQIGTMVQQKADNIKTFEESAWYEKLGSTFAMTGAKLGEGILSVVEDLGDGVVSLVGWVAPKDSGVEKWCSEFVQKEWSHDAFNFYYNSEFAKKSAFTEDSGLAGGFKLVGTVAAYCFAGGAVSGAVGRGVGAVGKVASAGSKVAQAAVKAGNVVGKLGSLASSSTWAATAVAGVAGMGSGTENALLNGAESFDAAARSGAKQGVTQAALAFAGGKLGEKIQKVSAGKAAAQNLDDAQRAVSAADDAMGVADDALGKAQAKFDASQQFYDDALKGADEAQAALDKAVNARNTLSSTLDDLKLEQQALREMGDDVAANAMDDIIKQTSSQLDDASKAVGEAFTNWEKAGTAVDNAITARNVAAQGLDDAMNVAKGARVGLNSADEALNGAQQEVNRVASSRLSDFQGYDDAITRAGQKFGANPVATTKAAAGSVINAGGKAVGAVGNAVAHPIQTVKAAGSAVVNTVKAAPGAVVNAVKAAPGAAVTAVKTVGSAVVHNPGVVAQGANAAWNNGQAAENIASFGQPDVDVMGPTGQEISDGYTDPTLEFRIEDTDPGTTDPGTTDPGTTDPGYTGPGYTDPGYTDPGYTGPGYTDPGTTNPGTTDPGTIDPGTIDPGTIDPGTTDPGYTDPGYTGPGYTGPSDGTGDETHTGSGFGGDDEFNGAAFEIDDGFGNEGDEFDSLADIIANGDKLTEIPQSNSPIKANSNGGASAVIPIAAGLSAAAAAGIGAKVYMDKKNSAEDGEDDEFDTDDWSEDGQIEIDYDESEGSIADQYLNDDDDYGYQADTGERYGARTSEELADLQ